jgi:hypothetical protein
VWKPKRKKQRLVLGMDVGLEDACNLAMCALVGRFAYKERCTQKLSEWMKTSWEPGLGYTLEVLTLSKGWMGFIFKTPVDSTIILNKFWSYDGGSLMLKRWRVGFNPESEHFSYRHLWILLLGLPLQLWNLKALE